MDIVFYLLVMSVSLFAILFACAIFTNAIEHSGEHLGLSNRTMGSIFAAIGTGLPETIVPLVAIIGAYITGDSVDMLHEIGIGAILGSPFMICTFAFFITGAFVILFSLLKQRDLYINTDKYSILRDFKFFIIAYSIALLASFIKFTYYKFIYAALLIGIYGIYIYRTIKKDVGNDEEKEVPLYFQILPTNEKLHQIILWMQILCSVLAIIYFSRLFVKSIIFFANLTHINAMILSLLLAPVATELPEMINSILWVKNGKDNFAFANLSGAIVYQATILPAIGVIFTNWEFNTFAIVNVVLVYLSIITMSLILILSKNKISVKILFFNGIYWLLYILYIVFMRG